MPQHRRREYLDEACANDAALRDEVDTLVAAHEASGGNGRGELTGIQWLGFALTEAVVFYGLIGGLLAYVLV